MSGELGPDRDRTMAVLYQGYAKDGEFITNRRYLKADVIVIANMEAGINDTIALLEQIIDELRIDPVP
jgi:hypothetical protein